MPGFRIHCDWMGSYFHAPNRDRQAKAWKQAKLFGIPGHDAGSPI